MNTLKFKIVKEMEYKISGYPGILRAKILKPISRSDKLYYGKISHFCKPSEGAGTIYHPTGLFISSSIFEVEECLRNYANSFTSIGVETNNKFDQ